MLLNMDPRDLEFIKQDRAKKPDGSLETGFLDQSDWLTWPCWLLFQGHRCSPCDWWSSCRGGVCVQNETGYCWAYPSHHLHEQDGPRPFGAAVGAGGALPELPEDHGKRERNCCHLLWWRWWPHLCCLCGCRQRIRWIRIWTLKEIAEMYASKFRVDTDKMMNKLWGESFFNAKRKSKTKD